MKYNTRLNTNALRIAIKKINLILLINKPDLEIHSKNMIFPFTVLYNTPTKKTTSFTSFRHYTLVKMFNCQLQTVTRTTPSESSIHATHPVHTNRDNGKESDKTKLGCQTGGLGNNKPPTTSTASDESRNFICVIGDFQSRRKSSGIQKTTTSRR